MCLTTEWYWAMSRRFQRAVTRCVSCPALKSSPIRSWACGATSQPKELNNELMPGSAPFDQCTRVKCGIAAPILTGIRGVPPWAPDVGSGEPWLRLEWTSFRKHQFHRFRNFFSDFFFLAIDSSPPRLFGICVFFSARVFCVGSVVVFTCNFFQYLLYFLVVCPFRCNFIGDREILTPTFEMSHYNFCESRGGLMLFQSISRNSHQFILIFPLPRVFEFSCFVRWLVFFLWLIQYLSHRCAFNFLRWELDGFSPLSNRKEGLLSRPFYDLPWNHANPLFAHF